MRRGRRNPARRDFEFRNNGLDGTRGPHPRRRADCSVVLYGIPIPGPLLHAGFPTPPHRKPVAMGEHPQSSMRDQKRIWEWQFLLLHFAITRDPFDRSAAGTAAGLLDAAASPPASSFTYFARTTDAVCNAIANPYEPRARELLERFVQQIDDARLRAALRGCLDMQDTSVPRPRPRAAWRKRQDLWRGLPKR